MLITYETDTGEIVIGLELTGGRVPVLRFKTWADYMAFIVDQLEFVEETYADKVQGLEMREFIESLEGIDNIGI